MRNYYLIYFLIIAFTSVSQSKISLDTVKTLNKKSNGKEYGLHVFEGNNYYDPILNQNVKNVFFSSCWNSELVKHKKTSKDTSEYCFFIVINYKDGVPEGIIQYYNSDSMMIMSGTMQKGKPNGKFSLFCSSFPYCTSVYDYPLREFVYINGKLISDVIIEPKTKNIISLRYKKCFGFKKIKFR